MALAGRMAQGQNYQREYKIYPCMKIGGRREESECDRSAYCMYVSLVVPLLIKGRSAGRLSVCVYVCEPV